MGYDCDGKGPSGELLELAKGSIIDELDTFGVPLS